MLRGALVRWWLSDFIASFGDGLRLAAFPLLAAGLTRSPAVIGAVVAVQGLPWLVVGPGLGVLVDRHDPRRVIALANAVQALVIMLLAGLVVAHGDVLPVVFAAALASGIAAAIRGTATQAGTPRMIDTEDLERVNGRLIAGELVGGELLGPASGGFLFGIAAALPFGLNAGGLGLAALLVLSLPSILLQGEVAERVAGPHAALVELRDGLRWTVHDTGMRMLIATVGVVAILDAAWFAVLVLYVREVLHRSPADYGGLLAAGAVGGIAASAASGRLARLIAPERLLVISIAIMAATQLVLGLTSSVAVAAAMLALSSGAFAVFNVVAVGMRQRRIPEHLFGRVTSVYSAVAGGAEALGALLGGVLASSAGIRAPMLIGVGPLLAVAVLLLRSAAAAPPDERAVG